MLQWFSLLLLFLLDQDVAVRHPDGLAVERGRRPLGRPAVGQSAGQHRRHPRRRLVVGVVDHVVDGVAKVDAAHRGGRPRQTAAALPDVAAAQEPVRRPPGSLLPPSSSSSLPLPLIRLGPYSL